MRVTSRDLAQICPRNIRVRPDDFGTVWAAAESFAADQANAGVTDWAAGGVAATCRWLVGAVTESRGQTRLPRSPITRRVASAYEELIEAEYLAAVAMSAKANAVLVRTRPGFVESVVATLGWAGRGNGVPPPIASDEGVDHERSNPSSA